MYAILPGIGEEVYPYGHKDAETQTEPSEADMGIQRAVTTKEGKLKGSVRCVVTVEI